MTIGLTADPKMKRTCAVIVCPGHSGSTLLGMCLNSHTDVYTFGEFASLRKRFARIKSGQRKGLCSFCYAKCGVMNAREAKILKWCYYSRFHRAAYLKSILTHPLYIRYLSSKMHAKVVCDTSKSVSWASFANRYCRWGLDLKYIFLFRDPRGVITAHVRKQRDIAESIESYKREMNQIFKFKEGLKNSHSGGRYIDVKYEDFVRTPGRVLRDICTFMSLDFQESMIDYDQHEHHIVGGNDKARSRVKRNFNQAINYQKPDIEWYLGQENAFFLDERWKTELTKGQRTRIESDLNPEIERLGYAA